MLNFTRDKLFLYTWLFMSYKTLDKVHTSIMKQVTTWTEHRVVTDTKKQALTHMHIHTNFKI